jgi:ribosomal protein S18 acetylase RimI-like enzyme
MRIVFRKCVPADVHDVVPLIYSSGPAAFSYVFTTKTKSATGFLEYAFQRKGGEFSFENHFALILNEEIVGAGTSFNSKQAKGFVTADGLSIIKFYGIKSLPVLINGLKTENVIKAPKYNEICIAHLGIKKEFRGQGLGTHLIRFLMKESKSSPNDNFVLDVSEENPKAKALYERLGFKVSIIERSTLRNNFGHVANHFRMAFYLDDLPVPILAI